MERTNKELRDERKADVANQQPEMGALDVRALAELELMLVGGGDGLQDWGG